MGKHALLDEYDNVVVGCAKVWGSKFPKTCKYALVGQNLSVLSGLQLSGTRGMHLSSRLRARLRLGMALAVHLAGLAPRLRLDSDYSAIA